MNSENYNWYKDTKNGIPESVMSTVDETITTIEKYYGIEFEELFISNEQNDGHEEYSSLWLFSDQDVVECKNFLLKFDVDIVKYKGSVRYVNIILNGKDTLENPQETSSMKLVVSLINEIGCTLFATGQNCQRLNIIAKRYMKEYKAAKNNQ